MKFKNKILGFSIIAACISAQAQYATVIMGELETGSYVPIRTWASNRALAVNLVGSDATLNTALTGPVSIAGTVPISTSSALPISGTVGISGTPSFTLSGTPTVNINGTVPVTGALTVGPTQTVTPATTWLASAARTSTQVMSDQVNTTYRGIAVYCNITNAPLLQNLTVKVQGKDPLSGTYFDVAAPSSLVAATGFVNLRLGPNVGPIAASVGGVAVQDRLPNIWRLTAEHSSTGSWTYSCSYSLFT